MIAAKLVCFRFTLNAAFKHCVSDSASRRRLSTASRTLFALTARKRRTECGHCSVRLFTFQTFVDRVANELKGAPKLRFDLEGKAKTGEQIVGTAESNETNVTITSEQVDISQFMSDSAVNSVETVSEVAKVSYEALNLTWWLPPARVYDFICYFHESCPWWASISIATLIARIFIFPLLIKMRRESTRTAESALKLQDVADKLIAAQKREDEVEIFAYTQKFQSLTKEHMSRTLRFMWMPVLNGAVFTSFFLAIREMSELPIPSMTSGGIFWFENLTVADPYCILPFLTSTTLFIVLKLGVEFGNENVLMARQMKLLTYIAPIACFVFSLNFPSALNVYWLTNNSISLIQSIILKQESVKKALKLPEVSLKNTKVNTTENNFSKDFKKSWDNAAIAQRLKERAELEKKLGR